VRSLQAPPPSTNKHNFFAPQPPQVPTPSAEVAGGGDLAAVAAAAVATILNPANAVCTKFFRYHFYKLKMCTKVSIK